eukprot:CAMPEP_0168491872 /NCGR_PEP_ID=MMETSP0228-20121227/69919_1 /TAXON_ID=133427 /ORGANISM="Protoceratium reticulatum, Strain CCCM 535 (=CCMP 1889)" /LENGTH=442 /DNA_ID=CAMNT_0008508621 /DNA_START=80 /DNA_END=1409 /DNA_ORIENTATION=-
MTPEEKYNSQVDFEGAKLEVLPLFDRVVPGFANKIPVLFQFVTGRDPVPQREPFSLAVVLDVSGSMQGSKLSSCKSAIAQLIEATEDDDKLSLVTYSDSTTTLFEGVRCGGNNARRDMRQQVSAIEAGGATNLYGGLLAGYRLLRHQADAPNKHVILLSDGQVTAGSVRDTSAILGAVADWEEKIPILSYGIGDDFNEALMSPLGQVHRGSHYFYITDAASIERLIAKGVRALTGCVARSVHLQVTPVTQGLFFPIYGAAFPLVRERSVIQYLLDVEVRPELPSGDSGFEVVGTQPAAAPSECRGYLGFDWEVHGFPLLAESRGHVRFAITTDRSFRKHEAPEVRTYLDVKRGCELRRTAAGSAEARGMCEQALQLFQGRLEHDRFGFAAEWASKTQALLSDSRVWMGGAASAAAAKHLGVAYSKAVVEEEEEEEMDFDLFG